jgi:hypothetical protein
MTQRPIRILDAPRPAINGEALVFAAEDQHGPLSIWVTVLTWENLQAGAPDWCDGEDRRSHALGMVEAAAADLMPGTVPDGTRIILVAD